VYFTPSIYLFQYPAWSGAERLYLNRLTITSWHASCLAISASIWCHTNLMFCLSLVQWNCVSIECGNCMTDRQNLSHIRSKLLRSPFVSPEVPLAYYLSPIAPYTGNASFWFRDSHILLVLSHICLNWNQFSTHILFLPLRRQRFLFIQMSCLNYQSNKFCLPCSNFSWHYHFASWSPS